MKNTIMITGTAKNVPYTTDNGAIGYNVEYNVIIWASEKGEQIQFICSLDKRVLTGYSELWTVAKEKAHSYFNEGYFQDGAYTTFLEHIILL